jgi:hypothetical protein
MKSRNKKPKRNIKTEKKRFASLELIKRVRWSQSLDVIMKSISGSSFNLSEFASFSAYTSMKFISGSGFNLS